MLFLCGGVFYEFFVILVIGVPERFDSVTVYKEM